MSETSATSTSSPRSFILFSETNASHETMYAMILVTPESAKQLLAARTLFQDTVKRGNEIGITGVTSILVWDSLPTIGTSLSESDAEAGVIQGQWYLPPTPEEGEKPLSINDEVSTEAETMSIDDSGVFFYFHVRHSEGGQLETERLSWSDIELMADGKPPLLETIQL